MSQANTWDAAVELLKLTPDREHEIVPTADESKEANPETWRETGIIADGESIDSTAVADMSKLYENLIKDGRAGGRRAVAGSQQTLLNSIGRSDSYKLIIFDDVFLTKGAAARKRLQQEWSNSLNETLKTPVISMSEIQHKYRFGASQFTQMISLGALTTLIVLLMFRFTPQLVSFLSDSRIEMRIIETICILFFVPLFAFLYSTVTSLFLKMLKFE